MRKEYLTKKENVKKLVSYLLLKTKKLNNGKYNKLG
jgi:hypothetical protein